MKERLKVLAIILIAGLAVALVYSVFVPDVTVAQGDSRLLRYLWLIVETHRADDAGMDDDFYIDIQKTNLQGVTFNPVDQPWDENEEGRTETYVWNILDQNITVADSRYQSVCITTSGDDAWLLRSLWLLGETVDGEVLVLQSQPHWPRGAWLSTDSDEGAATRSISGSAACLRVIVS
jgi:hypothetical protein